jgi:hypothetical protein
MKVPSGARLGHTWGQKRLASQLECYRRAAPIDRPLTLALSGALTIRTGCRKVDSTVNR